jgi:hypothetical protein
MARRAVPARAVAGGTERNNDPAQLKVGERGCVPRSGISRSSMKHSNNITNDLHSRGAATDAPHTAALRYGRIYASHHNRSALMSTFVPYENLKF